MTENEIKLVKELWENGKGAAEIARLLPYKEYIAKREIAELKKKGVLKGRSGKSQANTHAKVLQAFNDGITSPYELAELCGVCVRYVYSILSQAKIKIQRPKHNYKQRKPGKNTQAIIVALQSGKRIREISTEFGVSTQYVHEVNNKFVKGAKMKQTNTGCYGCKYNYNWQCIKEGVCTGVVPYENYLSSTSKPNYIPANTPVMPDELEINGVKYRRAENEK